VLGRHSKRHTRKSGWNLTVYTTEQWNDIDKSRENDSLGAIITMVTKITKIMAVISAIAVGIMLVASSTPVIVYAQFQQPQQPQQQQQTGAVGGGEGEAFESEEDGFRLQIPEGWVIEDNENVPLEPNREGIAGLCPESEALPAVGGEYNCQAANLTDSIPVSRWPDLRAMPEFENVTMPTTNDLVALYIQYLQNTNQTSDIQIVNSTDINEFRKIVTVTYTVYDDVGTPFNPIDDFTFQTENLIMFALSPDSNSGYVITNPLAIPNALNQTEHSPAVQEVFDSFEIVS
jgi:hypothetical protein